MFRVDVVCFFEVVAGKIEVTTTYSRVDDRGAVVTSVTQMLRPEMARGIALSHGCSVPPVVEPGMSFVGYPDPDNAMYAKIHRDLDELLELRQELGV